jgi:hypothetical protein
MKPFLLLLLIMLTPACAHAHGGAVALVITQAFLYFLVLIVSPIVAPDRKRVLAFGVTLVAYPIVGVIVAGLSDWLNSGSYDEEKAFEHAMYVVAILWCPMIYWLRHRNPKN